MNNTYYFKWKRNFFWSKVKVMGHQLDEKKDKMLLYLVDGSIREVKEFSKCELMLGVDWVLTTKNLMEQEAGQKIPFNV